MSARAKAPKAAEAWTIVYPGGIILPEALFDTEKEARLYARENGWPPPIRVLITPVPRRRKP